MITLNLKAVYVAKLYIQLLQRRKKSCTSLLFQWNNKEVQDFALKKLTVYENYTTFTYWSANSFFIRKTHTHIPLYRFILRNLRIFFFKKRITQNKNQLPAALPLTNNQNSHILKRVYFDFLSAMYCVLITKNIQKDTLMTLLSERAKMIEHIRISKKQKKSKQ